MEEVTAYQKLCLKNQELTERVEALEVWKSDFIKHVNSNGKLLDKNIKDLFGLTVDLANDTRRVRETMNLNVNIYNSMIDEFEGSIRDIEIRLHNLDGKIPQREIDELGIEWVAPAERMMNGEDIAGDEASIEQSSERAVA